MSLLGTFERSTSSSALQIATQPIFQFLYPAFPPFIQRRISQTRQIQRFSRPSYLRGGAAVTQQMDNIFIQALVRAGTCQEHLKHTKPQRRHSSFTTSYHKTWRKGNNHVEAAKNLQTKRVGNIAMFMNEEEMEQESKKELMSLVATYRMTEAEDDEKDLYGVPTSTSNTHHHNVHTLDTEILDNSDLNPVEPVFHSTEKDWGASNTEFVRAAKTIDFVDNTMKDQQQDNN